jgi:hypothetical protein
MATEERGVHGRRACSILSRRRPGGSLSTVEEHMFGQEVVRPHAIGICEESELGTFGVQLQQAREHLAHVCGVEEREQNQ